MHTTKRFNLLSSLCTLLALLAPLGAMAQPQNGSELTIAGSVLLFGYQEFDDNGSSLLREEGNIPGFVLGLSQTSDRWVFAGDFSYHGGNVNYTGQTQTGIPIDTHTRQDIADLAVRSEYWIDPRYALYLGAGYHHWDRDIQATTTASGTPVSGLFEGYAWWTGFVGAKALFYETGASSWLLDARLLQIINPTISVTLGQNDKSTLTLGERLGVRIALPWRYTLSHSSSLSVEPYAESYELGRSANTPLTSNGTLVGHIFEPHSKTANYGLTVGIGQRF